MGTNLNAYLDELKARGLSPEQEERFRQELAAGGDHSIPADAGGSGPFARFGDPAYAWSDLLDLQVMMAPRGSYTAGLRSLDELLERDRQREEDGFPRKIRVGKLVKPGRGSAGKVVVVPTTEEEKFIHDPTVKPQEEGGTGGTGDEGEGEIIGEQPVRPEGAGTGTGPGQGEGETHELESSAYDLGKTLTEKFQLPNLKEKGKKRSLTRYTYDLTDRNRGFGQVLDKKATLRKIIESNISLGNIPDVADIDPSRFLIAPRDKVYRILSREKDYDSQAVVFFLRDYSGSMSGKVTELNDQHAYLRLAPGTGRRVPGLQPIEERIGHALEQIVGVGAVALGREKRIDAPTPGDERRPRLFEERLAGQRHQIRVRRRVGYEFESLTLRQVTQQGVHGVVSVELGLLERQQVRLLDKHLDAPFEARQSDPW